MQGGLAGGEATWAGSEREPLGHPQNTHTPSQRQAWTRDTGLEPPTQAAAELWVRTDSRTQGTGENVRQLGTEPGGVAAAAGRRERARSGNG